MLITNHTLWEWSDYRIFGIFDRTSQRGPNHRTNTVIVLQLATLVLPPNPGASLWARLVRETPPIGGWTRVIKGQRGLWFAGQLRR